MRKTLLPFIALFTALVTVAQTRSVKGRVLDKEGLGISNVTVIVKGTIHAVFFLM